MDASSSGLQTNMNSPKMNSAHKVSLTKIYKIIEDEMELSTNKLKDDIKDLIIKSVITGVPTLKQ